VRRSGAVVRVGIRRELRSIQNARVSVFRANLSGERLSIVEPHSAPTDSTPDHPAPAPAPPPAHGATSTIRKVAFLPSDRTGKNPYQLRLCGELQRLGLKVAHLYPTPFFGFRMFREGFPDVLHLHWIHPMAIAPGRVKSYFKTLMFVLQLVMLRALRVRVVWTAHNMGNHEKLHADIDRLATRWSAKLCNRVIAHCGRAAGQIAGAFDVRQPGKIVVIPHGNYDGCYPTDQTPAQCRQHLNLPARGIVFTFFGNIRAYKGVLDLIDAFKQLDAPDAHLVIAGKVADDSEIEVIRQRIGGESSRIVFHPGFVSDNAVQYYLKSSDVMVYPYRDILTSGAVLLGMSFGRACVAPKIGCIAETLDDAGGILYAPGASALLNAMGQAYARREELETMGQHNLEKARLWSWDRVAAQTLDAYMP
jgi:beta-1,4-mannosyltransferase